MEPSLVFSISSPFTTLGSYGLLGFTLGFSEGLQENEETPTNTNDYSVQESRKGILWLSLIFWQLDNHLWNGPIFFCLVISLDIQKVIPENNSLILCLSYTKAHRIKTCYLQRSWSCYKRSMSSKNRFIINNFRDCVYSKDESFEICISYSKDQLQKIQ